MFKSASLSFLAPRVSSKTQNRSGQPAVTIKPATITWAGTRAKQSSKLIKGDAAVPLLSVMLIVAMGSILALHLFWVNTYSSKGFELKKIQTSINEQTEIQKKLLVKQSLLNSTVSLSDLENTGLVPVTNAENIVSNTFAQAK